MQNEETRKEIIEKVYLYTELDTVISGSLQEVANNILALEQELKTKNQYIIDNPDRYFKFNIEIQRDYEGSDEIRLYGVRMETDEEFQKRIEKSKKSIEAQKLAAKKRIENTKKKELQTFLRLKKKYEGDSLK